MDRRHRRPPVALSLPARRSQIENLPLWALSAGASSWIVDLEPYEPARVAGLVVRMRIAPLDGSVDAWIWDGTGEVLARWQIRRPTPELAVAPGRFVLVTGVPRTGEDVLVILEPVFEVVPTPPAA